MIDEEDTEEEEEEVEKEGESKEKEGESKEGAESEVAKEGAEKEKEKEGEEEVGGAEAETKEGEDQKAQVCIFLIQWNRFLIYIIILEVLNVCWEVGMLLTIVSTRN